MIAKLQRFPECINSKHNLRRNNHASQNIPINADSLFFHVLNFINYNNNIRLILTNESIIKVYFFCLP